MRIVKIYTFYCALAIAATALVYGCQKDYYRDSGRTAPNFDGNMMQYLESKPYPFDTLVNVIKIAGMQKTFAESNFTFFAPGDETITRTYNYINDRLKERALDTLTGLQSLKPEFWRDVLEMYMFRDVKGLEDYPQLDYLNKQTFSGEFVTAQSGQLMNIGAVFTNAGDVKYKGYRFLTLNFVLSPSAPLGSWLSVYVSSVNIRPTNGIVHALMYAPMSGVSGQYPSFTAHNFGFDMEQAWQLAVYYGFN